MSSHYAAAAERSKAAARAAWIAYHRAIGQTSSAGSLQDMIDDILEVHAEWHGECPFELVAKPLAALEARP